MKFTEHQRKKAVKLLRSARMMLSHGREEFICLALREAALQTDIDDYYDVYVKLRHVIEKRLSPSETLEGWLVERGHVSQIDLRTCRNKLQLTRLKWIDSLIKELK